MHIIQSASKFLKHCHPTLLPFQFQLSVLPRKRMQFHSYLSKVLVRLKRHNPHETSLSTLRLLRIRREDSVGKQAFGSLSQNRRTLQSKGCFWPKKKNCYYQKKSCLKSKAATKTCLSLWLFYISIIGGTIVAPSPHRWVWRCDLIFPLLIVYFGTQGTEPPLAVARHQEGVWPKRKKHI